MLELIEQTTYQRTEATMRGSLARQMLAMLINRWRFARRLAMNAQTKFGHNDPFTHAREIELTEAHNAMESARRILYGIEQ